LQLVYFDWGFVSSFHNARRELSPDISHGSEGRGAALRRPRAVQARNGRITDRPIRGPGVRSVPPLNAAGTAQRAIPTFVSLLPAEMFMKYPG